MLLRRNESKNETGTREDKSERSVRTIRVIPGCEMTMDSGRDVKLS